jgi:FtsP/CotA-like multicopper oxidase with cupredoxin domain
VRRDFSCAVPETLFWYHPHAHGFVNDQILGGMSGALVVDGIEELYPVLRDLSERDLRGRYLDEYVPASTVSVRTPSQTELSPLVRLSKGLANCQNALADSPRGNAGHSQRTPGQPLTLSGTSTSPGRGRFASDRRGGVGWSARAAMRRASSREQLGRCAPKSPLNR